MALDEQEVREFERITVEKVRALEDEVSSLKRTVSDLKIVVDVLQYQARLHGWPGL